MDSCGARKRTAKLKLLSFLLTLLGGCSTVPLSNISQVAHLYSATGEITEAHFDWNGAPSGMLVISRPTEECFGTHTVLVDGISTKSLAASLSILKVSSTSVLAGQTSTLGGIPSFGVTTTMNNVQRGIAIATCPSAEVFSCQYSLNAYRENVVGYGTCTTSKPDAKYQLIFK